MYINDYLTERLEELTDRIQEEDRLLIHSPTDSGKTYFTIQYAKANPHLKIALLVPTQNLVKNIKLDHPHLHCGRGSEWAKTCKPHNFIITTYDSFSFLEYKFDVVFVDEAHLLAGHADFRDVALAPLLNINAKTVFLTGTPEVINRLGYSQVSVSKKVTPKHATIYQLKQTVKNQMFEIIRNRDERRLTIIRVNSKNIIDDIFEMFKDSVNIIKLYSDDEKVICENQCEETLEDVRKGKIEDCVEVLLTTSIIDAGISLRVEKDVDCHALSTMDMPNAIDMVQLYARVRSNSGNTMELSIYGEFNEYELYDDAPIRITRPRQLMDNLYHEYQQYSKLDAENYINVLSKYDIRCEIKNEKISEYDIDYLSRLKPISIAKNLHNYPSIYYSILCLLAERGKDEQIKIIAGDKRIGSQVNSQVRRIQLQIESAIKNEIHLSMFIGKSYQEQKIVRLNTAVDLYTTSERFRSVLNELMLGLDISDYKMTLDAYNELNSQEKECIKAVSNLIYNNVNWKRKTITLKEKSYDSVVLDYVNLFRQIDVKLAM